MDKPTIVLADHDSARRRQISRRYANSANVHECCTVNDLVKVLGDCCPAVVLIGSLPGGVIDSIEAAQQVRGARPSPRVIVFADHGSEGVAIGALRAGVAEHLHPPVTVGEVVQAIDRQLSAPWGRADDCGELIGDSPVMRDVKSLIRRIAPTNSTVLITGESGTGKEVVAGLLHRLSTRAAEPLVCINCAAIPDSLVESDLFGHETGAFTGAVRRQPGQIQMADRGTLLLDEIGDLSLAAQSKLLRVIEQREVRPLGKSTPCRVDIRLIAATHRTLKEMVAQGTFRGDLFYRINVARIHLPPLRDRVEDVPALARHFLEALDTGNGRKIVGFTNGAIQRLMDYDWPGNVRELRNAIETATVMCNSEEIGDDDLKELQPGFLGMPMERSSSSHLASLPPGPEIERLTHALSATDWNVTKTARMLHWSRMTVYRKVAKYGVERPTGDDDPGDDTRGIRQEELMASFRACG